jgi:pyruvate formate lyase activating enzyme
VGCNLHCLFCQNWEISQTNPEDAEAFALPPAELVQAARRKGCPSVAFTYTEPLVFYEYTLETARSCRDHGLRNVLVTAGYLNREPLEELYRVTDASNTDLKAFDEAFYRDVCGASLGPVLDGLVLAKKRGVWLEVTNLLIPGLNDDPALVRRMCQWMVANLGKDTPLHFSRFQPRHRMRDRPATPTATLELARDVARAEGLEYVYVGNVSDAAGQSTDCPGCGAELIRRIGYRTEILSLDAGRCARCGRAIPGVWR